MTTSTTSQMQAPLDGVTEGHLVVYRGLGACTVTGDAEATELAHGRWTGRRRPRSRVHQGTVELTFPRLSLGLGSSHQQPQLNGSVPWRIEIDGGAGDVQADLSAMTVRSVDVRGGVARSRVDLPAPLGTLVVQLGATSDVVVTRPAGVPVRLRMRRGARDVAMDAQSLGAVGGPTTLAHPGYDAGEHRIDVVVDAADHLTITERAQ